MFGRLALSRFYPLSKLQIRLLLWYFYILSYFSFLRSNFVLLKCDGFYEILCFSDCDVYVFVRDYASV